jgi:hypothetical protein
VYPNLADWAPLLTIHRNRGGGREGVRDGSDNLDSFLLHSIFFVFCTIYTISHGRRHHYHFHDHPMNILIIETLMTRVFLSVFTIVIFSLYDIIDRVCVYIFRVSEISTSHGPLL